MRHLKAHRKLGRTSEHRTSMLRNLATSLINSRDERIVTTLPKAKELRPFIERAITLSRRARNLTTEGSEARALHLRRQAAGFFHAGNIGLTAAAGRRGQQKPERSAGVAALRRLFGELGERYQDRPGGYTRILKLGHRDGDRAELAIIELVDNPREREAIEAEKKRKVAAVKKKKTDGKKATARSRAGDEEKSATGESETKTENAAEAEE
jgi:large subunit ribosomal protein L17